MNQEIAEFFVKFTTKNFEEVKDALDSLSKKMDDVSKASKKAADNQDSLMSKIGDKGFGWIKSILSLTAVVWGLKKAWDGVARVSAETMDIYQQAMMAGTSPQTIERWQVTANRQGLGKGEVASSFMALRSFLYDYQWGDISQSFNEEIGKALNGIANKDKITNSIISSIQKGNVGDVLETLNTWFSSGQIGDVAQHRILSAFGIDNKTFYTLLNLRDLTDRLTEAPLIKTGDPEVLKNSAQFTQAKAELNEAMDKFWLSIQPEVTRLVKWFADEGIPAISDFLDRYWPQIETSIKDLFNWILRMVKKLTGDNTRDYNADRDYVIARERLAQDASIYEKYGYLEKVAPGTPHAFKVANASGTDVNYYRRTDKVNKFANDEEFAKSWNDFIYLAADHISEAIDIEMAKEAHRKEAEQLATVKKEYDDLSARMWESLTPAEQMSLFSHSMNGVYEKEGMWYNIPGASKGANATAIVNIDGKEVARTSTGNLSILDYTTEVPLSTR